MIPVKRAKEPSDFDEKVRQPGLRAIAEMVGKQPASPRKAGKPFKVIASSEPEIPPENFPHYWTKALDELMERYGQICAYACFRIHRVTGARSADHFAPKSRDWRRVYEWSNYRLCCSRMNSRKRDFGDVMDPFSVKPDWFHLELVGFQVIPNRELDGAIRIRIQDTIDRLGLNGNDFREDRAKDAELYWARDISLKVLRQESPFVAAELRRQGRLNQGDAW